MTDNHDEWRDLNVGLGPPAFAPTSFRVETMPIWRFASVRQVIEPLAPIWKMPGDGFIKPTGIIELMEKLRRDIAKAFLVPEAYLGAGPRLGDRRGLGDRSGPIWLIKPPPIT